MNTEEIEDRLNYLDIREIELQNELLWIDVQREGLKHKLGIW